MTTSAESLLDRYEVDRAHARYVADLALAVFDGSKRLHRLPARTRELVELGALLHNVGLHINENKHHKVGRDIILNSSIETLDDDERAIIACIVAFHRKKVRPNAEVAFLRLGKKRQATALQLAAIVRVADGLDYSQSQTTAIESITLDGKVLHLTLHGPHVTDDGARATEKATLWKEAFGTLLLITAKAEPQPEAPPEEPTTGETELVGVDGERLTRDDHSPDSEPLVASDGTPLTMQETASHGAELVGPDGALLQVATVQITDAPWKLQADDTLSAAARKVLRQYFQKLLTKEASVQKGDDPEDIHQMRVATRRLRATLAALGPAIDSKQAQRFRKQIRAVASELGAVRDHDVFLLHIAEYSQGDAAVPPDRLAPLSDALTEERNAAKARLLQKLDKRDYERFKRAFARFVTTSDPEPETEDGPVARIRYAAGGAIWQAYQDLRAYETLVPINQQIDPASDMTRLHEMRIAGKRFRYTLDLFSEALDPQVEAVIAPLVELQDYLGALQDIEVATAYVEKLDSADEDREALDQYIQARHADRSRLLEELPTRWATIAGEGYRRQLMEVIGAL